MNFYSYYLSFLLLKKHGYNVSIICNKAAYDLFLKYIPYDEVINTEPPKLINHYSFWVKLKINTLKLIKAPFTYVDGDLFLFNDLIKGINEGDDSFVTLTKEHYDDYYYDKYKKFKDLNPDFRHNINNYDMTESIMKDEGLKLIDSKYTLNTSVFHVNNESLKEEYIDLYHRISMEMLNSRYCLILNHNYGRFLDKYLVTYLIRKYNLKHRELVDEQKLFRIGLDAECENLGVMHMFRDNKFKKRNIDWIKAYIQDNLPDQYEVINEFEKDMES